jgi:hypothetical protein
VRPSLSQSFTPTAPGTYVFKPYVWTTNYPSWQTVPSSQWVTVTVPSPTQLQIALGPKGIASLTYAGYQFLSESGATGSGEIQPYNRTPVLQQEGASTVTKGSYIPTNIVVNQSASSIEYDYPDWGTVTNTYTQNGNTLQFHLTVQNTHSNQTINDLQLMLGILTFPDASTTARTLDAGAFGRGSWMPVYLYPLGVNPTQAPPVIEMRTSNGAAIVFASDNPPKSGTISSIYIGNNGTQHSALLAVDIPAIAPNAQATVNVSLRFNPTSSEVDLQSLVSDVLQSFKNAYPQELNWSSRAPIGALILASSQAHPASNPRGWDNNSNQIDTTTSAGLLAWRQWLLKYADASIKVLQSVGAQGMITWDPEGEQYANAVYYGAPQLTSTLAPETDFAPPGQIGTMDKYFAKFRAAGFRTGVAIRPQHIVFDSHRIPTQETIADTLPELLVKVQYASQRWGCTIFYIDSTVTNDGTTISADVMEGLHEAYPNYLFIPEEKNYRDYAYVAPLNSFSDFGITGTPATEYEVYPQAFSSIFIHNSEQGQLTAARAALTASAKNGDLFIFNAWYQNEQSAFLQQLYQPTPPVVLDIRRDAQRRKSGHGLPRVHPNQPSERGGE